MASLHAGTLLARRYRLIDQIGAGGMSVIWRARDEVLDRVVAVKVLAPALAASGKFRELVREEARAAAQLVHPHVTSVHDYGETIAPDGQVTAFVVMELLTGEELEAILTAGPLPWRTAVQVCAEVAEAVAAAHRLGIVHRDVTPANIMMTEVGAKVLDFGIATHVGAPDEDEDGETFGTPAYVAPERLDGRPAQPATDTYSLGVLLFQTLTGRVPFPADTWDDLTRALQANPVVPPLTGVPGLPAEVAEVCRRCLARDPAQRPTAHQVGESLRRQLLAAVPSPAAAPPATVPPADALLATAPSESRTTTLAGPPAGGGPAERVGLAGAPVHPRADEVAPDRGAFARSPLRTLVLATAAAVTLAAAVLAFAPFGSGRGDPLVLPTAAGPDDTSPPTPVDKGSPSPEATPTTSPITRAYRSPSQPATRRPPAIGDVMTRVDQLIDEGVASGDIVDHAGVDLRNYVRNLRSALIAGSTDVTGQVAEMRTKVAVRANEGSINRRYADELDTVLAQLAAPT